MGCRGGSNKLQLYPANLAYSTLVMGWKGLWNMDWRRFCRVRRVVWWFLGYLLIYSIWVDMWYLPIATGISGIVRSVNGVVQ
jgi:hypothetical protein